MSNGAKAEAATVRGNPILPPPAIPKKVLESNIKPPLEAAKGTSPVAEGKEKVEVKAKVDEKVKGTITISVFENKPYEAKFTGEITGNEMIIAVNAVRKQYKLWKRELLKAGGK